MMKAIAILCASILLCSLSLAQSPTIPYPIIFVHGWTGDENTFGGLAVNLRGIFNLNSPRVIHVCLNHDNLLKTGGPLNSEVSWIGWTEYGSTSLRSSRDDRDRLFLINFSEISFESVANHGRHIESNQASATKQGYALSLVIDSVLALTHADKVILVGHSMGGLAIREYLQRKDSNVHKWWHDASPDGHRVGKVVTIGTPHRGSNFLNINGIPNGYMVSKDLNSEAVRDLRYDLGESNPGPYLFGGREHDASLDGFYNRDIDGDGQGHGAVVGLNEPEDGTYDNHLMPLPPNIRYTWIVSNDHSWTANIGGNGGDWIVDLPRQWLWSGALVSPASAEASPKGCADSLLTNYAHWDEGGDFQSIARGLDEPSDTTFAYEIKLGQSIQGLITYQTRWIAADTDMYRIQVPSKGTLRLDFSSSRPLRDITFFKSYPAVDEQRSASYGPVTIEKVLNPGTYFVRLTGEADQNSSHQPYILATSFVASPSIRVTSPSAGDIWRTGDSHEIHWTTVSYSGNFDIFLAKAGVTVSQIASNVGGTVYPWTTPQNTTPGADYSIWVVGTAGFPGGESGRFSIVASPPSTGSMSANPSSIPFNGSSFSTITVNLRNSSGNPAAGVAVSFDGRIGSLPSGGFNPGTAITNSNGVATTTFTPDRTGTVTITGTVSETVVGSTQVIVKPGGSGTYTISMTNAVISRASGSVQIQLNPYVTYTSNGQPVDGKTIVFTTDLGLFKNGQQTYSEILGLNNSSGRISNLMLNCSSNGTATLTVSVEQTIQVFTILVSVDPVPVVQPFLTLSAQSINVTDFDHKIAFSSDGRFLAAAGGTVWKAPSYREIYRNGEGNGPTTVSFSKTGLNLVMGANQVGHVLRIYDTQKDTLPPTEINPPSTQATSVAWSDQTDGQTYALSNGSSGKYNEIQVYVNGTPYFLYADNPAELISCIDWKGDFLAALTKGSSANSMLYLFNTGSRSRVWKYSFDKMNNYSVAISPDRSKVAVIGRLYDTNNLFVFNINSPNPVFQYALGGGRTGYYSLAWSPDGTKLVCSGEGNSYLRIIDLNNIELYSLGGMATCYGVAWGKGDVIAAYVTGSVNLYAPFDVDGPSLRIVSPVEGFAAKTDLVAVTAFATDVTGVSSVEFSFDGNTWSKLTVTSDTVFSGTITLPTYENVVRFKATDRGGRQTVFSKTIYRVPAIPFLASPANGAAGLANAPTLMWNPATGAAQYEIQISTDSAFSNVIIDQGGTTGTSYSLNALAGSTVYYWRVNASNSGGTSGWSNVWNFTTIAVAPEAPALISPINGAAGVETSPTLSWKMVMGATRYRVQVSTSLTFTAIVLDDSTVAGTSKVIGPLGNSTLYYWRVNATNAAGKGPWSEVWSFSTVNAPPPPPTTGWAQTNGPCGGPIRCLAVLGGNLFAGTDYGSIYLSTNNGTNWTAVNTGLTWPFVRCLAVSGTNLFAGTDGMGVFLSTDNGTSWAARGLTSIHVVALAVCGTDLFAGTENGVFITSNNGSSWTAVNTGLTNAPVQSFAVSGTNLFAGTRDGIFLSSNYGTSWTAANTGLTNTNVKALAVSGTNLFAGTDGAGVFLSTNNGASWVNSGLTSATVWSLAVSGTNLFAGTNGDVLRSTNNGTTWTQTNAGSASGVVAFAVSGTNLLAGTQVGAFLSTNNGTSWIAVNTGLTHTFVRALAVCGTDIYAGTEEDAWLSSNNGTTWTSLGLSARVMAFAISAPNIFAGTNIGVFLSTNHGSSWTAVNTGLTTHYVDDLAISGVNLFAGTDYGVFLSTNNGASWSAVNTGLPTSGFPNAFVTSLAVSGTCLFAGTLVGRVFVSTNSGTSWTEASNDLPTNSTVNAFALSGSNTFVAMNGGVYFSNNNGSSWKVVNTGLLNASVTSLEVSGASLFAGTLMGVFLSTNNGTNWTAVNAGLPMYTSVYSLSVSGANLFAGTFYRAVWRRSIDEMNSTVTIPAPPAPSLGSPASGSSLVSIYPMLIWFASPGATSYRLQISLSPTFATAVVNDSTITDTTKTIGPLQNNVIYYWRVSAKNDGGTSGWSSVRSFRTIVAAPQAPIPAGPVDSAKNLSTTPIIGWAKAAGASTYCLQVSLSSSFSTTVVNDSTITDTTKTIGPLQNNTTYYWRVSAKNEGGTSGWSLVRSFTTIVAAPQTPTLAGPVDSAKNLSTTPIISWAKAAGASTYCLQVSLSSSFSTTVVNDSTITDTTKTIGPLQNNTTYYWRVNAKNEGGTSGWSLARSFTTIVVAPQTPTLAGPVDTARNVSIAPTLSWVKATGAVTYRLQASLSSAFSTMAVNDSTITDTTKTIGPLQNSLTYYWRVSAKNDGGTSPWSQVRSFTTIVAAPQAPTLAGPVDTARNVSITPTLSWAKATGAVTYRLQVSLNLAFSTTVVNDSTITDTMKVIGPLQNNATYYWRVNATNAGGTSPWSTTRSFTTIIAAPQVPVLAIPADSAVNVQLNTLLSWNTVSVASLYHLQVSTTAAFASLYLDDSTLSTTSRSIGQLSLATTYFWRVRAKNEAGWGAFSSSRRFSTIRTTSVEQVGSVIPTEYALSQNYPNPFNPSTTIRFGTPKTSYVTLKVFDLLGREVATLVSQELGPGYYSVRWQGDVPSGTYIYRLQAGEFVETKKMILLR